ncbi:TPA: NAD-dependent epimerase/dehydratase family protein [Vibrio alginolyticus]|nr:NAD-dependent epimerase/dehydratase family protein [Vibrio alginolyticus]EHA1120918.1 NAD-dependent epimerase/dehydratase family protein [Vibrio alginolyticus]HCE3235375.1 NAD-dependent epimerase/dehydratase family protein [Vibrio parahaemolyticus]HCZ9258675.1 NAD-dependent epimerase/dehydratase family protein [Vibrio alginolyticus]HCZ9294593.1 NAD-dependent epimerase/dehydratase family protein [Vibrio alginolyticus]
MILLTGKSGFIGSHFTECAAPGSVRAVVREPIDEEHYLINSLNRNTNWEGAFKDIDVVVHLAGIAHSSSLGISDYHRVNVEGTLKLAEQAARHNVKRFVFVSSIGVNGKQTYGSPFNSSSPASPHNDYSLSKYNAELELKKLARKTGLELVIVRPTLVYGPNAPGSFGMLQKLVSKFLYLPFGLANNHKDFISVQNLVDLLLHCSKHPNAAGHVFLASDGETVSIKEFTNAIAYGLGKKVVQLPVPVSVMRLVGKLTGKSAMIEQLYGHLEVDSSNIKEVLGWTPPLTMKEAMATLRDSGAK